MSIRNDLGVALRVHGLCARDGGACAPVDVAPGSTRDVRFASGRAGTYHYWATSMGAPVPFRELAGALVVDPPSGPTAPDRIFVITEWTSLTAVQLAEIVTADDASERFLALGPTFTFVMNGLSWPATERLVYRRGEVVRWRVINLSSQRHPMHLHGFYFNVMRVGDGRRDEPMGNGQGQRVVTHVLPSGGTLSLEWTAEREGNWLFHCHIMSHVSPERRLGAHPSAGDKHAAHDAHHDHAQPDPSRGMAGMVLGITVLPSDDAARAPDPAPPPRQLTMLIGPGHDAARNATTIGVALGDTRVPDRDTRNLARPASGAPSRRARRDHGGESPYGADIDSLAWARDRELLRRSARLERPGRPDCTDDRARRRLRRADHAAARWHVHLPHPPARLPSVVVGALRAAHRGGTGRRVRPRRRPRHLYWGDATRRRLRAFSQMPPRSS